METKQNTNWWFLAVNGIIAILFGLLLVLYPQKTVETLVFFFGLIIFLAGLALLGTAIIRLKKEKKTAMLLAESIATIAIGIIIMLFTQNALKFFLILMGVWAVILGIVQLVVLINTKGTFAGKNIFLFNGLLTLAMGVLLFFDPYSIADFLVKLIGVFSFVFGCVLIYLSFVLRRVSSAGQQ
jgi:uncharacterized membrane protein HdeD (DUF308 family)